MASREQATRGGWTHLDGCVRTQTLLQGRQVSGRMMFEGAGPIVLFDPWGPNPYR